MVEASGVPRADDVQRPLEESAPPIVGGEVRLRPAVPASADGWTGARHATRPLLRLAYRLRALPQWSATAIAGWAGRPAGRFALPGALITALVGSALAAGVFVVPTAGAAGQDEPPVLAGGGARTEGATPGAPSGAPPVVPPLSPPPAATATPDPAGPPADSLRDWAQQTSIRTGIPVVALQAYGYAELVIAQTHPACGLSWTTLAAIGRVESDHGHAKGATLQADGRALPPITGDPLDGQDNRMRIADTDDGALDNDVVYDRAVGPMQFIPTTWATSAVDATGDGVADVHNIHDAALAAGNYLCHGGRNLATATGWWAAILSYNNLQSYADEVFTRANEYGRQSRT